MHPILCKIGPFNVYSWGFMVALGCMAALAVMIRFGRKEGIRPERILDVFVYMIISAVAGARLFYVIQFFPKFRGDLPSIFYLSQGGLVFLGGFCGVLVMMSAYVRYNNINLWKLLDACSPGTILGYAIGRIGCFLNGCCYGIKIFGVEQPTQIYSSLSGLVIFFALIYLYRKKKYDGQIFLFALFFYSIYRFLLEFIRYNPVHYWIFTPNQLLAALLFTGSSYLLWKKNTT